MLKRFLPLLIVLALPIVFCATEIRTSPIVNQGKIGDIMAYSLLINNTDSFNKSATIFMLTESIYAVEPFPHVILPANSQTSVIVKVVIPKSRLPQRYYEDIFIKFSDLTETTQQISYDVRGADFYLNLKSISVQEEIDPLNDFNITLLIDNKYFEKAKTAMIQLNFYDENNNSIYYQSEELELLDGLKNYTVKVNIGKEIDSDHLKINASLKWYDLSVGSAQGTASIIQGYKYLEVKEQGNEIIFSNSKSFSNPPFTYEKNMSLFEALLIKSASVPYTITPTSVIFEVPELKSGEEIIVSYEVDYSIPVLIAALLLLLVYLSAIKKLKITKTIKNVKASTSSLSFKTILSITNVSNEKFAGLKVRDILPPIISDIYDFGTIEGEVKSSSRQKTILWTIKSLKPKETVELSYYAKTKIGFFGDLSLKGGFVEIIREGKSGKRVKMPKTIISVMQREKKSQ